MALIISPPRPITIGFCDSRSTRMRAVETQQPLLVRLLESVDDHRRGKRQLGVRVLQHLLAHQLGDEEPLRLIGQVVLVDKAARLPAGATSSTCSSRSTFSPVSAETGTMSANPTSRCSARSAAAASLWQRRSTLLSARTLGLSTFCRIVHQVAIAAARRFAGIDDRRRRRRLREAPPAPRRPCGRSADAAADAHQACRRTRPVLRDSCERR